MPRTLILMRHAKQSTIGPSDHERPLLNEGREAAHGVGERLRSLGLVPDRVLSSTALRCRQTCESLSAAFDRDVDLELDGSLYNASPDALLDAIAGVDPGIECLLLLAHNPGISMLGLALAGSRADDAATMGHGFSPASVACFEIDGEWSTVSAQTARLLRFDRG